MAEKHTMGKDPATVEFRHLSRGFYKNEDEEKIVALGCSPCGIGISGRFPNHGVGIEKLHKVLNFFRMRR